MAARLVHVLVADETIEDFLPARTGNGNATVNIEASTIVPRRISGVSWKNLGFRPNRRAHRVGVPASN